MSGERSGVGRLERARKENRAGEKVRVREREGEGKRGNEVFVEERRFVSKWRGGGIEGENA